MRTEPHAARFHCLAFLRRMSACGVLIAVVFAIFLAGGCTNDSANINAGPGQTPPGQDPGGNTGTDTTYPTVNLTAPAAGSVSGTVTLSANASDNVGVVGVQFRLNGANLGSEDTTSPYSTSWNTTGLTPGATYSLSAFARDAAGLTASSANVSVTIAMTTPEPTVTLSAANTSIAVGSSTTLTWSSTHATTCTASGAWSGSKLASGTQNTGALNSAGSYTFNLNCTGTGGNASDSVTIAAGQASTACDSAGYSTEKFDLTTLPHCLDMGDDDYLRYPNGNPVAVANGNASIIDEPTGSYAGSHSAKIVPPTTESYAGLGNFNFLPDSVGSRMNLRYLVYWGYDAVQSGVKLNIMNDGVSTRPMVISRELRSGVNTTYAHDFMIPIPSQNVNEAPTINDPGYPNHPSFFIAGAAAPVADGNYAHQWVCWEFEIITAGNAPILNLYVHTRDGVIAYGPGNPYATHAWTAGVIDLMRASVGWYWGPGWIQSPEAYVKVSDVVISNSYIGPPTGFVQ